MGIGRPSSYKPEYDEQAYKLCLLGADDKALANFFEVCEASINNWKIGYPSFLEAIKDGKERADAEVAKSLYHRALGYSCPEDKVFNNDGSPLVVPTVKHYPPDPTAAIFWLKNRRSKEWRDKQEVDSRYVNKDGEDLSTEDLRIIERYNQKIKGALEDDGSNT